MRVEPLGQFSLLRSLPCHFRREADQQPGLSGHLDTVDDDSNTWAGSGTDSVVRQAVNEQRTLVSDEGGLTDTKWGWLPKVSYL